MTKNDYEIVYKLIDTLLNQKLGNYSNTTKTAAEFEDMYMREYAGGAAIDHVLFRRFLRQLEVVKGELSERLIELENLDTTNIYTDIADIEHPQENYGYFLKAENGDIIIYTYNGQTYDEIITIPAKQTKIYYANRTNTPTNIAIETSQDAYIEVKDAQGNTLIELNANYPLLNLLFLANADDSQLQPTATNADIDNLFI